MYLCLSPERRARLIGWGRRSQLLILGCAILTGWLSTSCQRRTPAEPDVTFSTHIVPAPARVGHAIIAVRLAGKTGAPLTGATVSVEGNMSHPGMAPVFGDARETKAGEYEAPLEFTMGGDWLLTVSAILPGGQQMEREVRVPGVRS